MFFSTLPLVPPPRPLSAPPPPGQKQQVDPELFRVFYTSWKDAEAEAQDVDLPSEVIDHLDHNECVYKLSSCVKTSCGVGIIAMTQKRLFLLPQGRPAFLEITKFRDIQVGWRPRIPIPAVALELTRSTSVSLQEVKLATASFVLVRTPSLHIQSSSMSKVFEANLKTDTELWHLAVKEMWAGRRMADDHKVHRGTRWSHSAEPFKFQENPPKCFVAVLVRKKTWCTVILFFFFLDL